MKNKFIEIIEILAVVRNNLSHLLLRKQVIIIPGDFPDENMFIDQGLWLNRRIALLYFDLTVGETTSGFVYQST